MPFKEKFVEKSEPEPKRGIIEPDDAVNVERTCGIIPRADTESFQDHAEKEFPEEDMHHIDKSADEGTAFSVGSRERGNDRGTAVDWKHPE